MWPFEKSRAVKSGRVVKRLITGLIIGGAIGSVVGKHLLDKHEEEISKEGEDGDENASD